MFILVEYGYDGYLHAGQLPITMKVDHATVITKTGELAWRAYDSHSQRYFNHDRKIERWRYVCK